MTVLCDYCGLPAKLVTGSAVYPHRADLASKNFYQCEPCKAWVGVHPGTITPLGRLANAELRGMKQAAHAAFDPLWEGKIRRDKCSKSAARRAAYAWLSEQTGIPPEETHIAMMDVARCRKVIEVCREAMTKREAA